MDDSMVGGVGWPRGDVTGAVKLYSRRISWQYFQVKILWFEAM